MYESRRLITCDHLGLHRPWMCHRISDVEELLDCNDESLKRFLPPSQIVEVEIHELPVDSLKEFVELGEVGEWRVFLEERLKPQLKKRRRLDYEEFQIDPAVK